MFDSLSTRLQDVFKTLRGETRLTPENDRGGAARDPARAARGRRQLQGRQGASSTAFATGRWGRTCFAASRRRSRSSRSSATRWSRSSAMPQGGLQPTNKRPRVILLLGLQGAGKTTTAGKLAKWLTKQGRHPLLVSTDVKRPAAIQQLNVVGAEGRRARARPGGPDGSGRAREGRGRRSREPRVRRRHRRLGRAGCTSTTS